MNHPRGREGREIVQLRYICFFKYVLATCSFSNTETYETIVEIVKLMLYAKYVIKIFSLKTLGIKKLLNIKLQFFLSE